MDVNTSKNHEIKIITIVKTKVSDHILFLWIEHFIHRTGDNGNI